MLSLCRYLLLQHHPKLLQHDWKGKPSVWPHFGSCSSVIQCFISLCSERQRLGNKQDSFPDAQPESSTPIFFTLHIPCKLSVSPAESDNRTQNCPRRPFRDLMDKQLITKANGSGLAPHKGAQLRHSGDGKSTSSCRWVLACLACLF